MAKGAGSSGQSRLPLARRKPAFGQKKPASLAKIRLPRPKEAGSFGQKPASLAKIRLPRPKEAGSFGQKPASSAKSRLLWPKAGFLGLKKPA